MVKIFCVLDCRSMLSLITETEIFLKSPKNYLPTYHRLHTPLTLTQPFLRIGKFDNFFMKPDTKEQ